MKKLSDFGLFVYPIEKRDNYGNIIYIEKKSGYKIWKEYDEKGNEVKRWDSTGAFWHYEFNSKNNLIHSWDSAGNEYWFEYDEKNTLIYGKHNKGKEQWLIEEGLLVKSDDKYTLDGKEVFKKKD